MSLATPALVVALWSIGGPTTVDAEEIASIPATPLAPTAMGAPFTPEAARTAALVQRAELLSRSDTVSTARDVLRWRAGAEDTARILDAEMAALDRAIDAVPVSHFADSTEAFGIDVGVFPVAELRKPFRNDWGEPRSGGRRHQGTDLLAQIGVPLLAIEDGYFEQTTNGSLGGLSVYLIGESGARYYYAHLDEAVAMQEGETVYAGQVIGTVGDSGNAKGSPHLHIQWAPNGDSDWQNPYPLLAALYGEGSFVSPRPDGPPIPLR